ncbi:MAG: hypothetical protein ABJA10_02730 [Aestuariivirga sp.]
MDQTELTMRLLAHRILIAAIVAWLAETGPSREGMQKLLANLVADLEKSSSTEAVDEIRQVMRAMEIHKPTLTVIQGGKDDPPEEG